MGVIARFNSILPRDFVSVVVVVVEGFFNVYDDPASIAWRKATCPAMALVNISPEF